MKTITITLGLSLLVALYLTFFNTLWFIAGALWGIINLYFIKQLLYALLLEQPKNFLKIALLALIKFPILYAVGFWLLFTQNEASWVLLAGFSTVLLLSTQKRLRQAFQVVEKNRVV